MATASQPQDTASRPSLIATPEPAPNNRGRIVLVLVILAAVLGIGWGLKQWLYGRTHESTDNAQVDGTSFRCSRR